MEYNVNNMIKKPLEEISTSVEASSNNTCKFINVVNSETVNKKDKKNKKNKKIKKIKKNKKNKKNKKLADYFAYGNFQNDNIEMFNKYESTEHTLKGTFARENLENFFKSLYTKKYKKGLKEKDRDLGIKIDYQPRTRLEWYVYLYKKATEFLCYFERVFEVQNVEETKIVNVPKQKKMQLINTLNNGGYDEETINLVRRAKYLQSHYSKKILNVLNYLFKNSEYLEMIRNIDIGRNEKIDIDFISMGERNTAKRVIDFLEFIPVEIAKTISKRDNKEKRKNDYDEKLMQKTSGIFEKIFGISDLNNLKAVSERYVQLYNMYKYLKRVLPKEFKNTEQFDKFKSDLQDLHTYTVHFMRYKVIIKNVDDNKEFADQLTLLQEIKKNMIVE